MRKLQSANILTALEAHPAFRAANTVLLYHSLNDEVDTHEFIQKWSNKKRILLPVVVGDDLELRIYTGPENMSICGVYGIEEPTGKHSQTMQPSISSSFPESLSTQKVIVWDEEKDITTASSHAYHQPIKLGFVSHFN